MKICLRLTRRVRMCCQRRRQQVFRIFLGQRFASGPSTKLERGRKILASLAGNEDYKHQCSNNGLRYYWFGLGVYISSEQLWWCKNVLYRIQDDRSRIYNVCGEQVDGLFQGHRSNHLARVLLPLLEARGASFFPNGIWMIEPES
eukprot:06719_4